MPPKHFASTHQPLVFIIATVAISLICQSLKVQAAEQIKKPDLAALQHGRSALSATDSTAIIPAIPEKSTAAIAQLSQELPNTVPSGVLPQIIPRNPPPSVPLPQAPPSPLPPPSDLLQPGNPTPAQPEVPSEVPQTVFVEQFKVEGSTVFDANQLATLAWQATELTSDTELPRLTQALRDSGSFHAYCPRTQAAETAQDPSQPPTTDATPTQLPAAPQPDRPTTTALQPGRELSFEQVLRARSAITQLYLDCGYITSGAILPPQTPADQDNNITLQVVEGSIENIEVTGLERLRLGYVRSRLAIATHPPLQRQRLLQALQLLQLNPLIRRISANLQAGTRPSTNILQVEVAEADSFQTAVTLDNNRAPSVGSFQRGISLTQANLLGLGDGLSIGYLNTDGSNQIQGSYSLPVNPRNGTVTLNAGYTHSNVIEPPFDVLGISSDSYYYDLTFRQPLYQTPTEEFALGLTFSRQESQTELSIDDIGPFPLSPGADDQGRTRVSAARLTQEWIRRTPRQVLAARSQFSFGLDLFNSTVNSVAPDSRFFAWRGQGQWVRQLDDAGTLLLARTDMQFTGDALVPPEQFGIGGQDSVRGYRQDAVLTDNGIFAVAELQWPILRIRRHGKLYLVPSIGAGVGWNVSSPDPEQNTLMGAGLGLLWRQDDDNLSARLDFGIPLISVDTEAKTWQENGLYFSIRYSPF